MKNTFIYFCFFVFIFACKEKQVEPQVELLKDCEEVPVAIFADTMDLVNKHYFEQYPDHTIEIVAFKNGMFLELMQSGCKYVKQQFNFNFVQKAPANADDAYWKAGAISSLDFLSTLNNDMGVLGLWSAELKNIFEEIKLGQPILLEAQIEVMIDKIESDKGYTIVLVLSQIPSE